MCCQFERAPKLLVLVKERRFSLQVLSSFLNITEEATWDCSSYLLSLELVKLCATPRWQLVNSNTEILLKSSI